MIRWQTPVSDGCLPLLGYTIERDGTNIELPVDPSLDSFTDTFLSEVGNQHTYRVRAFNLASLSSAQPDTGYSAWSEPLTLTVGYVPNAPTDLEQG